MMKLLVLTFLILTTALASASENEARLLAELGIKAPKHGDKVCFAYVAKTAYTLKGWVPWGRDESSPFIVIKAFPMKKAHSRPFFKRALQAYAFGDCYVYNKNERYREPIPIAEEEVRALLEARVARFDDVVNFCRARVQSVARGESQNMKLPEEYCEAGAKFDLKTEFDVAESFVVVEAGDIQVDDYRNPTIQMASFEASSDIRFAEEVDQESAQFGLATMEISQ